MPQTGKESQTRTNVIILSAPARDKKSLDSGVQFRSVDVIHSRCVPTIGQALPYGKLYVEIPADVWENPGGVS